MSCRTPDAIRRSRGSAPGIVPVDAAQRKRQGTAGGGGALRPEHGACGLAAHRFAVTDGAPSPRVRVRLLGRFAVWAGEREVPEEAWRLRKARSLVKLLALAPGRRLHRERVGELLWPERELRSVANNLHQAAFVARRALDAAAAGAGTFLAFQDDSLSLSRAVEVDVDAFEAAAVQARAQRTREVYQEALGLYGGELLPEDLSEHWTAARRLALREQHVALLLELAELDAGAGRRAAAVEAAQQAILEAPLHEGAHRALMRFLVADGRRQEALVKYEQLRGALRRELEARPDPESRSLHRDILSGPEEPSSPPERAPAASERRPAGKTPLTLTSFIGRRRERAEIAGLVRRSRLVTLT